MSTALASHGAYTLPLRRSQRIADRRAPAEEATHMEFEAPEVDVDVGGKAETTVDGKVELKDVSPKWALRPRKVSQRSAKSPNAKAAQHTSDMLDEEVDVTALASEEVLPNTALVSSTYTSVSEYEKRCQSWSSKQAQRSAALVRRPLKRRISGKMRPYEVYIRREARIQEALDRREKALRRIWKEEVQRMHAEVAQVQKRYSEEIRHVEISSEAREAASAERKKQIKEFEAAVARLQAKIEAAERQKKPQEREAPKAKAAPSPKASPRAALGRFASAKAHQARTGRTDEAPSVKVPEAGRRASGGVTGSAARQTTESAAPVKRTAPRSPTAGPAPYVEFVGAPVGKGAKVPSGLWPWPSDVVTRSRARAL